MNACHLETIRAYWSGRVAAYASVDEDELGNVQAKAWDELIAEQLPWAEPLRILDVGCAPAFSPYAWHAGGMRSRGWTTVRP